MLSFWHLGQVPVKMLFSLDPFLTFAKNFKQVQFYGAYRCNISHNICLIYTIYRFLLEVHLFEEVTFRLELEIELVS
jgi:hypothetical protein